MKLPKLILSDIDGVWTDGGMYYATDGIELKKFHTYDSAGILFCKIAGIKTGIISGEDISVVKRRAEKLNVDYCFLGIKNKVKVIDELLNETGIKWEEIAYLGDDINDMGMLKKAGFSGVVSSAPDYMKSYADYITKKRGGEGAFREFVEFILTKNNKIDEILENIEHRIFNQ